MKGIKGIEEEREGRGILFLFCGNVDFVALSSVSRVSPPASVRPTRASARRSRSVGPCKTDGQCSSLLTCTRSTFPPSSGRGDATDGGYVAIDAFLSRLAASGRDTSVPSDVILFSNSIDTIGGYERQRASNCSSPPALRIMILIRFPPADKP